MTRKIKALHGSECQICGTAIELPNGQKYAEAHHIIPLGSPHFGTDAPSNIIVVCPNHHAMLDLGCTEIAIGDVANVSGHQISNKSVAYHNEVIVPSAKKTNATSLG
jgi:predicted restriction endonuclease